MSIQAPWLPEAAPRVAAPLAPPPPNPFARAVLNGFNPPTKSPRKRHFPWVPLLMVILLVGAAGAAYKYVLIAAKPQPFLVQTEAFRFTFPDTPTIEPLQAGAVTGTQWIAESGRLSAVAWNFGAPLDDAQQQLMFDRAIAGGANAITGTVTSDTWSTTNGVYRRDTIIAIPEGMIHMISFGKGAWMVLFGWGPTSGSDTPRGLTDVVATFSFV